MTTSTVDRTGALVRRIRRLDGAPAALEAVALGLVDALLAHDDRALEEALGELRAVRASADDDGNRAGWLDALISAAHAGLERLPSRPAIARGTQAHDFLSALATSAQLGSTELRHRLETDETQVSRTGRGLLEAGLVIRRKVGRQVFWQLTPRGKRALEEAPAQSTVANFDFWQAALRRGFEAASGDQPGPRREVDPTRERIIRTTLELHNSQGIKATTWQQIADSARVPVETVNEMFPTLDALVRGCGQHFFETLQLPPTDRASELFAGAASENERIRRMTQAFFGVYERGADGITEARRERNDIPALEEAVVALESSFDALVAEALRDRGPDGRSIASLRALTDVEVWRALREQGASHDAAVEEMSSAVERWLDAHPVG